MVTVHIFRAKVKPGLKGILKKRSHGELPRKSVRIGGIIGQGAHRGGSAKMAATSQSIIRDSLELSREHLHPKNDGNKVHLNIFTFCNECAS